MDQANIPHPAHVTATSLDVAQSFLSHGSAPVVLKAITLEHKAKHGLVVTDLYLPAQVESAWRELAGRANPPFLVQRQAPPGPELIVGFRQDPAFGPVVLFGLGGHFAEQLAQREVRLAPISEGEAQTMVQRVLGERIETLARILIDVSRLAAQRPNIVEFDLNPIILGRDGPIAVDVRLIHGEPRSSPEPAPEGRGAIRKMLEPRSVAIIGASANLDKPGSRTLRYLRRFAPRLPIYAVNPRREVVDGVQTVATIDEIPRDVDVAVVATPGPDVQRTLDALHERRITAAIVFASGFGEVGDDAAERELRDTARRLGVRVCGVNSMGVAGDVPLMFSQAWEMQPVKGSVSYVAQSGALCGSLLIRSWHSGLGTARAVSVGNQTDLEVSDFVQYLAEDSATRTVGVFLEGVRDGRRLTSALGAVTKNGKGLVVLRAGASDVGSAAARSHTATLAGSPEIYRQIVSQAGGVMARDLVELVALCQAMDWQPRAASRRVAIVSTSGGAASLLADLLGDAGLVVSELEDVVQRELRRVLPVFASTRNPLDTTAAITYEPELLGRMVEPVLASTAVDLLVVAISTLTGAQAETIARDLVRLGKRSSKPIVIGWSLPEASIPGPIAILREGRLPVFDSFALAASSAAALCPAD